MRKIGTTLVLGAAALLAPAFSGDLAHAAPQVGPVERPSAVRPGATPVAILRVEATVTPLPNNCGEPAKFDVTLKNRTLKAWNGIVNLVAGGTVNTPVSLAASGDDATKTIHAVGPAPIDCKKPLGSAGVRVWADPSSPILTKAFVPKTITARRDFMNGPIPTTLTLRSVMFEAQCGGKATPRAIMYMPPTVSKPHASKVKLSFGAASAVTVVNAPGTQTEIPLEVPGTVDCQAPTGIPNLDYSVNGSQEVSGSLAPAEVSWGAAG